MTNLQSLSMFLTERLMLAAQDIYKAVEVTVTEYHDEISRSRQENELLKRRLLEAGIEFYPESQPGPSLSHGEACIGSDRKASDEEMQVKREVCAPMQEADVPQHQAPISEEPVSPSQCFEAERRVEELFRLPTAENGTNSLLHAQQCMQIKEEISESKSGLRTEAFGESHSGSSTDPSSAVATGHASGLENELDRISSMHKDPEHPLTNKLEFTGSNRPANYDHGVKDKELTQKRERISKPAKVGRERKMEAKMENSRACSKKQSVPEVLLLDEEQSLPTLFQVNAESISEKEAQLYHEASALYHGQPRAHQCVVCGRSFGSRGLLKVHLRVHSGERPYHCPYCDKNFRQSSHLSVHIRIHTGEKPYTCLSCGKRFSDRSACNRHVKAHFENS